jgi:butyrate kinase
MTGSNHNVTNAAIALIFALLTLLILFEKESSMEKLLVINPGSTSTKIAVFFDDEMQFEHDVDHPLDELKTFESVPAQKEYRKNAILQQLNARDFNLSELTVVVGRGGILKPLSAGVYQVNKALLDDAENSTYGEHASNLGPIIAYEIGKEYHIPAFIADPVSVDEFTDMARLTGLKEIQRKSLDHPLNVRAVLQKYCQNNGLVFNEINAVVAHLGGGISVSAVKQGKIIDVNNANEGGPFSSNRAGTLPSIDLVNMAFKPGADFDSLKKLLLKNAGLISYTGTHDLREVVAKADAGDTNAQEVIEALGYQIAKEIGGMSAILRDQVHVIILTGGMSHQPQVTEHITNRVRSIAPVHIEPGSDELRALALAGLRAQRKEEKILTY